jgi:hypothetical protein
MKQSNKEGSPSAETVEERTPPEGNGGQAAADRTQRRDAASNGLAAVRQAARQSLPCHRFDAKTRGKSPMR